MLSLDGVGEEMRQFGGYYMVFILILNPASNYFFYHLSLFYLFREETRLYELNDIKWRNYIGILIDEFQFYGQIDSFAGYFVRGCVIFCC